MDTIKTDALTREDKFPPQDKSPPQDQNHISRAVITVTSQAV